MTETSQDDEEQLLITPQVMQLLGGGRGEGVQKPKQIATKTGLCITDRYLHNCRDKYLPVCTGTPDRARHPSPQGKLRTMRHYMHFAVHDHHTPSYIPLRGTLGSDSDIDESQTIHINILIRLCQWGERRGI